MLFPSYFCATSPHLSSHSIPITPRWNGDCLCVFVLWLRQVSRNVWCMITFVGVGNCAQFGLQFWIYSCVFHKLFKIANILICTLLMTNNMSTIYLVQIFSLRPIMLALCFRVVKISFYIWHFKFTYHYYKQQFSQSISEIPTICTHHVWFSKSWLKHRLKNETLIN